MHELSIANSLVEIATEQIDAAPDKEIDTFTAALEFSFELVTKDTILEGAILNIEAVPVTIYCTQCEKEVELPSIQKFRCPECDMPSADIRQGKELEVVSIEVIENEIAQTS